MSSIYLFVGLLTILMVAIETRYAPWSPYYWITALFIFTIPYFDRTTIELFQHPFWNGFFGLTVLFFLGTMLWEMVLCTFVYEEILVPKIGKKLWSPTLVIESLHHSVRLSKKWKDAAFIFLLVFWAPIAEETFYCGFLFRNFRQDYGLMVSLLEVGFLSGCIHACQFFSLRPFPWPAAFAFGITAFGSIILNCLLFEWTHNIYILIVIHLTINVLWTIYQHKKQGVVNLC